MTRAYQRMTRTGRRSNRAGRRTGQQHALGTTTERGMFSRTGARGAQDSRVLSDVFGFAVSFRFPSSIPPLFLYHSRVSARSCREHARVVPLVCPARCAAVRRRPSQSLPFRFFPRVFNAAGLRCGLFLYRLRDVPQ
ncbi:hypothetical protein TRVL_02567 [Trypanosoma vivax]|nr:hypothetical protein TRVL_02567 [Trypanosoma vivax]